jgi:hypothetical protein
MTQQKAGTGKAPVPNPTGMVATIPFLARPALASQLLGDYCHRGRGRRDLQLGTGHDASHERQRNVGRRRCSHRRGEPRSSQPSSSSSSSCAGGGTPTRPSSSCCASRSRAPSASTESSPPLSRRRAPRRCAPVSSERSVRPVAGPPGGQPARAARIGYTYDEIRDESDLIRGGVSIPLRDSRASRSTRSRCSGGGEAREAADAELTALESSPPRRAGARKRAPLPRSAAAGRPGRPDVTPEPPLFSRDARAGMRAGPSSPSSSSTSTTSRPSTTGPGTSPETQCWRRSPSGSIRWCEART